MTAGSPVFAKGGVVRLAGPAGDSVPAPAFMCRSGDPAGRRPPRSRLCRTKRHDECDGRENPGEGISDDGRVHGELCFCGCHAPGGS